MRHLVEGPIVETTMPVEAACYVV